MQIDGFKIGGFARNRTKRNLCANILIFLDYRAGFEKNLCVRSEIMLNRGQNVQEN